MTAAARQMHNAMMKGEYLRKRHNLNTKMVWIIARGAVYTMIIGML